MLAEWRALFKNKLLLISLAVLLMVPGIYALIFLSSLWDPYGKLDQLPVAVVNLDQPARSSGKTMHVGADLAKNLKKNTALDFHITSKAQAEKGLKNGSYYMILTIPQNFSKNAGTLMDTTPKKMQLTYETSTGQNFIAAQFSKSAATALRQKVATQVTKTYSQTLFNQIKQSGKGLQSAANGANQLKNGATKLDSGSQTLTTNLQKLASSTLTFENGSQTLTTGIKKYVQGAGTVSDNLQTVDQGTSQLATGTQKLVNGSTTLTAGLQTLQESSSKLGSGVQQLANGETTLNTSLQQLPDSTKKLLAASQQLQAGATKLQAGIDELNTSVPETSTLTGLATGLSALKTALNTLAGQTDNSSATLTTVQAELTALQTTVKSLQTAQANMTTAITSLPDNQALTADEVMALKTKLSNANNEQTTATGTLVNQLNQTIQDVTKLQSSTAAELAQIMNTSGNTVLDSAQRLAQGTVAIKTALNADAGLKNGAQTLTTGLTNYTNSVQTLQNGANQLASGSATVHTGLQKLASQTPSLTSGVSQLATGSTTLQQGLTSLNQKVPTLQSGIHQLATGAAQLKSQGSQLTNGASQINSGSTQLASASQQLANGGTQLTSGATQLVSGTSTLGSSLQKGADKANSVTPTNKTYTMFASPVSVKHTDNTKTAKNNGTGMAPYMMSVYLFVGMTTVMVIFDSYNPKKYPRTGFAWWASKFSVLAVVGLLQATISFLMITGFLGLHPVNPFLTWGTLVIEALAFTSIIFFANLIFGRLGSLLMILFLVFQLAGSGGTYPIQLSNSFFQAIHPFLPMTYGIDALRQSIALGGSSRTALLILVAVILVFNLLSIGFFHLRKKQIGAFKETPEVQAK